MSTRLVQVPTGERYELRKKRVLIGRGEDCDIVLGHATISSSHCVMERNDEDGHWYVQDLESTNGTWVNNLKVERCPLSPGDIIGLGKSLRYRFESIE